MSSSGSDIRETILKGHNGPVLCVDFDPLDNYIASSSCDGTVRIWKISESKEVKSLPVLVKCNDPELSLAPCRIKWEPRKGEVIVIFLLTLRDSAFENICNILWPERATIYGADRFGAIGFITVGDLNSSKKAGLPVPATNEALSPDAIRTLMDTDDADDFADLLDIAATQAEEQNEATTTATADTIGDDIDDAGSDADSIAISHIKSSYMRLDEEEDGGDETNGVTDEASQPQFSLKAAQMIPRVPEIKSFQPGAMPTGTLL
ncbi:unnamed protein product [Schistocephalus solidus]|uniref:Uncharacterized protein n=1 Tax=Schistocephalus solidus TaxID=70667 RepID=A0A3P7F4A8_SCHSO|nr:unnamed protein product [Schistocephalus solidus]